jgi:GT2 family glycosyltransferase
MISVVIPNWNGKHHLVKCLDSLRRQAYRDFEAILIDNGSVDGSAAFVRDNYPEVKIIELSENLGFAAGVNVGIRTAIGDYIALLNNDTEADINWLRSLSTASAENPGICFFASKLLNYYNRTVVDSAGDGLNLWLGPYKIGEKEPSENYLMQRFVFGACGGGGCYKRELFDQIGLFDEDFFAYFEDSDLSFRANLAGFRCLLVPNAVIYHKVAATSGANNRSKDRFDIMRRRNYVYFVLKNYPLSFLMYYLPFIFAVHCLKFITYLCRGRFRVAFMTQWEVVKGLPKVLEKRRAIMAGRRIGNFEIRSRCIPKYDLWRAIVRKKFGLGDNA